MRYKLTKIDDDGKILIDVGYDVNTNFDNILTCDILTRLIYKFLKVLDKHNKNSVHRNVSVSITKPESDVNKGNKNE